jgi:dienelactone hydrolase
MTVLFLLTLSRGYAMRFARFFMLLVSIPLLSIPAFAQVVDLNVPQISMVQYQSLDLLNPEQPLTISGQLRVPVFDQGDSGIPAVVVLHGSAGIDSRGSFYIQAINDAGIATFEIDMFSARGLGSGRPALPTINVPDAFGALQFLSQHPMIDPDRIALLGFSWGGVVTMLAANESYTQDFGNGFKFAAHIAHYPVCWAYNIGIPGIVFQDLTGMPVLIQVGELDDYDEGSGPCRQLVASLSDEEQAIVSVESYVNAHHAWDRLQPAITVFDPFSHLGAGGEVDIVPSPGKASQSRRKVVAFLQQSLEE